MKLHTLLASSLAAAVLLASGCASTGHKQAAHASTSLEKTAHEIRLGNGQIDAVLFSLDSLVHSPAPDLKAQFNKFDSAVTKLESLSKDVTDRAADMQKEGADYFRTWDEELAKIQNESIRSRSTVRKNIVAANFERVRVSYMNTRASFTPFMSDLKDIRTALAMDLTVAGLASVKPAAANARTNAVPLRESIYTLESDFRTLGVSLSTANPAQ